MLQVSKEQRGDILLVRLSGAIDEKAQLNQLLGLSSSKKIDFILKEVSRINSIGVKNWIKIFQSLIAEGKTIRLLECSTVIVEQVNLISNFTSGAKVESLYVPYSCSSCGTELLGLFRTGDLLKIDFQVPELKCSKCGGRACFDDVEAEYFSFLKRK